MGEDEGHDEERDVEGGPCVVVLGAGVVGLSVARAIVASEDSVWGEKTRRVVVLERHSGFGLSTSGRNSEVIHAGIYYQPSSLKARLCVRGRRLLYEYLAKHNVSHVKCGKLLVACSEAELGVLDELYANARQNGVELVKVTPEDVAEVYGERNVRCVAALWSPESGIMDARGYMASLERDVLERGGEIRYNAKVVRGTLGKDGTRTHMVVEDAVEQTTYTLRTDYVVNAAGLHARAVSLAFGIDPAEVPRIRFAKGHYFEPSSPAAFSKLSKKQLVYPIPVHGGLGIHATIDVRGGLRFGPDVEFLAEADEVDSIDYSVDPIKKHDFEAAISKYYIDEDGDTGLRPGFAGVRPKAIGRDNKAINDFVIKATPADRFIGLYGIESPGLTASLAIGEYVVELLSAMYASWGWTGRSAPHSSHPGMVENFIPGT